MTKRPRSPAGEQMTLGNMRANGVRSLDVSCWLCHHRAILDADQWPDDVPVPTFGPRMVCTACGIIGADARPNWREQPPREALTLAATGTLRRIAIAAGFLLAAVVVGDAMTFTWRDHLTVHASGPIETGDAAQFAALPKFDTLELDSPGGLVGEALRMAANMDARGGIRTVVKPGSSCASACAMALFVSGETRMVYMGGRVGIHSCATPDGTQAPECNKAMAANATAHGVPWGVVEAFGNQTKPSSMLWLGAEDAECWGLMKWSAEDSSNDGLACWRCRVDKRQTQAGRSHGQ